MYINLTDPILFFSHTNQIGPLVVVDLLSTCKPQNHQISSRPGQVRPLAEASVVGSEWMPTLP
jgi:hypothetical protein